MQARIIRSETESLLDILLLVQQKQAMQPVQQHRLHIREEMPK